MTKAQGSIKLGTLLVEAGHLSDNALKEALIEQQRSKLRLGDVLKYLGLVSDTVLVDCLAKQFSLRRITLSALDLNKTYSQSLPENIARTRNIVLYRKENNTPVIVVSDPSDFDGIGLAAKALNQSPVVYCALKQEIVQMINLIYSASNDGEVSLPSDDTGNGHVSLSLSDVVKRLFSDAYEQRASDIHIDCSGDTASIRFRADGRLYIHECGVPLQSQPLLNRIKTLFNIPVDVEGVIGENSIELAISDEHVISARLGVLNKAIAIRLESNVAGTFDPISFGLDERVLDAFYHRLQHTQGLTLFTGSAGSGRTTSLYSAAAYLNTPDHKLVAYTPNAEHVMNGVEHIKSDEHALRSVYHRDPDVVLMEEIESSEAAANALKLTSAGIKVISTLNAPSAIDAALRILHLSTDSQLLSMRLDCIVSQRLIRKNCPHCVQLRPVTDGEKQVLQNRHLFIGEQVSESSGCKKCYQRGTAGRVAVFEMLTFTHDMRQALQSRDTVRFTRLAEEALRGVSTLDQTAKLVDAGDVSVRDLINMVNYPLE